VVHQSINSYSASQDSPCHWTWRFTIMFTKAQNSSIRITSSEPFLYEIHFNTIQQSVHWPSSSLFLIYWTPFLLNIACLTSLIKSINYILWTSSVLTHSVSRTIPVPQCKGILFLKQGNYQFHYPQYRGWNSKLWQRLRFWSVHRRFYTSPLKDWIQVTLNDNLVSFPTNFVWTFS
jgi:hypothetical protein